MAFYAVRSSSMDPEQPSAMLSEDQAADCFAENYLNATCAQDAPEIETAHDGTVKIVGRSGKWIAFTRIPDASEYDNEDNEL